MADILSRGEWWKLDDSHSHLRQVFETQTPHILSDQHQQQLAILLKVGIRRCLISHDGPQEFCIGDWLQRLEMGTVLHGAVTTRIPFLGSFSTFPSNPPVRVRMDWRFVRSTDFINYNQKLLKWGSISAIRYGVDNGGNGRFLSSHVTRASCWH